MALAAVTMVIPVLPVDDGLSVGGRAPITFVAAHDAQYESAVLTQAARDAAAASVDPVTLPPDTTVVQRQRELAETLLAELANIRALTDTPEQDQFFLANDLDGAAAVGAAALTTMLIADDTAYETIRAATVAGINDILAGAVLSTDVAERVTAFLATEQAPVDSDAADAVGQLLLAFVLANVEIDEIATAQRREDAANNVTPEVRTVAAGQQIVEEGEVFTAAAIEALRETGVVNDDFDYADLGAGVLFAVGFGALLGIYVYQLQPFPAPARRRMLLTGVSIAATIVAVRFALPPLLPDSDQRFFAAALPVGAAAMVTASFSELRFAAVVAGGVAAFATFIAATTPVVAGAAFTSPLEPLQLVSVYALGGLAGAVTVHRAERLGRYAVAAVVIAAAVWIVLVAFWLLEEDRTSEGLGWLSLAAAGSGLGSAILGIGVYVILSMALGVTTRLRLMEIAQAGHPLLKQLQDEAPGTYHHSMMVGTLAERAADRIGADSLIVRAGAYFHDIGKIAQPSYYIENQLNRDPSPHDELDPENSARIIIEHVTNGSEIARKHRLPDVVRDFIPEHHGTRLVTYFYRRARADGGQADASKFRYAGPSPQTKESAIVMLADSCEALVRARQARTGEEMDVLVDSVFAERLAEGQFNECDVTMRELQAIATSFKSTLRAVYHPRIEYPPPVEGEPQGADAT